MMEYLRGSKLGGLEPRIWSQMEAWSWADYVAPQQL